MRKKAELAARKAEIAERRRPRRRPTRPIRVRRRQEGPAKPPETVNKNGASASAPMPWAGTMIRPLRRRDPTDPQEIIDEQAVEEAYKKAPPQG